MRHRWRAVLGAGLAGVLVGAGIWISSGSAGASPVGPAQSSAAAITDSLLAGRQLTSDQQLVSTNGSFRFVMQGDGNVVLYSPIGALWASWTFVPGTTLTMQTDGNLVAYAPDGRPVWYTGTGGSGATRLVMQSDGNAVLYRPDNRAVWATGTSGAVPLALRGQDIEVIPTSNRVVALTFDAGANSAGLPSILATLASRNVPATFFLTGQWAVANPAAVADLRARGYRIGNHSMTHPSFTSLTDAAIRQQVLDAQQAILNAGADPRGLFRFPFGDRNAHTIDVVNSLGYVPVRWTVDTLGWRGTSGGVSAQLVVDRALGSLRPGEIVLMHVGSNPDDGSTLDADALPTVIDRMRSAGYGFVTLDAIFG